MSWQAGPAGRGARELPVLDLVPEPARPGAPRGAAVPDDLRVVEFRSEDLTLPRFWVWTLGCQMNRSDSEEMAGRLLAAGCSEAGSMEIGRPDRDQHVCDPRGRRGEGDRPAGRPP